MNNRLEELKQMVTDFEDNYSKFSENINKAAGTRAIKTLQDIRNWSKDVRMEISEAKKTVAA